MVAKFISAVVVILALVSFKNKRMVVQLPGIMAELAFLIFTSFFQLWAVLGNIKNLIEGAIRIAATIPMLERVMREGFGAYCRMGIEMLLEI